MSKWLLRWYWTLFGAPFAFFGALTIPEIWLGPNAVGRAAPEWFFQGIVVAIFAASVATLVASLVGFRVIARQFGAPGLRRWPLYAGLVAMTVGTLVSALLFLATTTPIEARAAGSVPAAVRS